MYRMIENYCKFPSISNTAFVKFKVEFTTIKYDVSCLMKWTGYLWVHTVDGTEFRNHCSLMYRRNNIILTQGERRIIIWYCGSFLNQWQISHTECHVSAAQECNGNYLHPHNSYTMCILKKYNAPSNKKAESVFLPCFVFFFPTPLHKVWWSADWQKKEGLGGSENCCFSWQEKENWMIPSPPFSVWELLSLPLSQALPARKTFLWNNKY